MTTMYDAPMQDFSGDNSMDADMLPSSGHDGDWLQAEAMMDDGDYSRLVENEVEMAHEEVLEYEMTDAGEPEMLDYQDMEPDVIDNHYRTEIQDQEIPDASRAPSPIPHHLPALHESSSAMLSSSLVNSDTNGSSQAIESFSTYDTSEAVHHVDPAVDRPDTVEQSILEHTSLANPAADPEAPTSRGDENVPEHHLEASAEATTEGIEPLTEGTKPLTSATEAAEEVQQESVNEVPPDHSATEPQIEEGHIVEPHNEIDDVFSRPTETEAVADAKVSHDHTKEIVQVDSKHEESAAHEMSATVLLDEVQDDEESLIEPPPCVLLSFAFDDSNFALFDLPGDEYVSNDVQDPAATDKDAASGAKRTTTLLFQEKASLYYEPISAVFTALRADEATNVEGRFDQNVELVIIAPDLDLTLSEDNIHARDVSLHDLGILHTGCDLSGSLSLRLDTIAPRFGTRYKAIRDEIFKAISQHDDYGHQEQVLPEGTVALQEDGLSEDKAKASSSPAKPSENTEQESHETSTDYATDPLQRHPETHQEQAGLSHEPQKADGAEEAEAEEVQEVEVIYEHSEEVQAEDDAEAYNEGGDDDAEYTEDDGTFETGYDDESPVADVEEYVGPEVALEEVLEEGAGDEDGDNPLTEATQHNQTEPQPEEDASASNEPQNDSTSTNQTEVSTADKADFDAVDTTALLIDDLAQDASSFSEYENLESESTHGKAISAPNLASTPAEPLVMLRSTASKRSFDEHEADNFDADLSDRNTDPGDAKRLKVD